MKALIIAAVAVFVLAGTAVALTTPDCSNPVMHLKFDWSKPGMVCVVTAFDQDIVIER